MESITIGQIVSVITCSGVLAGFFIAIYKFYKNNFTDKFSKLDKRVLALEKRMDQHDSGMKESIEERLILLRGLLACLEGLSEKGCNGPVTQMIDEIKEYLISKTH